MRVLRQELEHCGAATLTRWGLFSYQIFMLVKPQPSLELPLTIAERQSGIRASLMRAWNWPAAAPRVRAELFSLAGSSG